MSLLLLNVPASAMYSASERKIDSVPSVAMNGGTFPQVTMAPFSIPPITPTPSETANAAVTAHCGSAIFPITMTPDTPASASKEPIDRSIPPAMMTIVMPSAAIPVQAT